MSDKQADHEDKESGVSLTRQKINIEPGVLVIVDEKIYKIKNILDYDTATGIAVETGRMHPLKISKMKHLPLEDRVLEALANQNIEEISEKHWKIAVDRFEAIKPLLKGDMTKDEIQARAKEVGVHYSTLYRWFGRYKSFDKLPILIPKKRGYKSGKNRLSDDLELIIKESIGDVYLTKQRSTQEKVVQDVMRRAIDAGIKPPCSMTVRKRIAGLREHEVLKKRGNREKAKNKFTPAVGNFPNADYPLAVVQIDHTPADIILVDDENRKPIGRPYITLAIDVYSRMVVGYYVSFDPPSETSVALCVAHAILPKENWLTLHNIDAIWEVSGFMDTIHTDNGADFRSDTLKKACLIYGINLEFRPPGQPNYGGHIERLNGTLLREIHDIPGTTFSNTKERKDYDSEKNAVMTFSEFEKWLVSFICKVYHERRHSSIGMTPRKKWEIGIFGNIEVKGRGLPAKAMDPHSLLLDFLPYEERTIQTYGVSIGSINYYHEVLRSWINDQDPVDKTKKRKFTFRIDPRDISEIWFFDPVVKKYFKIPAANTALPSMSAYELKQQKDKVRKEGMKSVNTHQLIKSVHETRQIVEESAKKTKSARLKSQRLKNDKKRVTPVNPLKDPSIPDMSDKKPSISISSSTDWDDDDIQPFDDLA
ncbi:MAG: DDE-type integrase/transposase/recombinase [Methylicorpusculum sp.]|uniref:Mu transposase C-terminal domain-containing protein n=1 Tax=Methylicorpusculum sp. TaxID=2713644 RepID=UPI0027302A53|nr:DDE-type integrase/transposase/recombinase [Methylicorpusculum sp.]MDP2200836.1 DDE-type integrase/transposase/recombinase [Methylicorpusculum sp.]